MTVLEIYTGILFYHVISYPIEPHQSGPHHHRNAEQINVHDDLFSQDAYDFMIVKLIFMGYKLMDIKC